MDRKRALELQTHRLVSSGAGASAVSTNTFRAPTEPAAGTWAEQDRLRPAGSPQDRQGSRMRRRPLRCLGESARPCGMRSVQTFDTVAGRRSAGGFRIYSNCLPKRGLQNTSGMHAHALASA